MQAAPSHPRQYGGLPRPRTGSLGSSAPAPAPAPAVAVAVAVTLPAAPPPPSAPSAPAPAPAPAPSASAPPAAPFAPPPPTDAGGARTPAKTAAAGMPRAEPGPAAPGGAPGGAPPAAAPHPPPGSHETFSTPRQRGAKAPFVAPSSVSSGLSTSSASTSGPPSVPRFMAGTVLTAPVPAPVFVDAPAGALAAPGSSSPASESGSAFAATTTATTTTTTTAAAAAPAAPAPGFTAPSVRAMPPPPSSSHPAAPAATPSSAPPAWGARGAPLHVPHLAWHAVPAPAPSPSPAPPPAPGHNALAYAVTDAWFLHTHSGATIQSTPETQRPLSQEELSQSQGGLLSPERGPVPWGHLHPKEPAYASRALIGAEPVVVGRSASATLQVKSPTVSSKHCSFFLHYDGLPCVMDHGSSNGTFLNGERLTPKVPRCLAHGDEVSLVQAAVSKSGNALKRPRVALGALGAPAGNAPAPSGAPGGAPADEGDGPLRWVFQAESPPPASVVEKARAFPDLYRAYVLTGELGRGNFATVFRAYSRASGERVAVKIVERSRHPGASTDKWYSQVVKEAEVLRQLNHPGIVGFRDLIVTENALFVVTELLSGGELFDRLVQGPYPEPRAKRLVKRILDAVAYLHDRGIVHRDIKPENIVMSSPHDDLDVKLVDFGVATEESTGRRTFCGSMSYVAPEVLSRRGSIFRRGTYGKSVDMWSTGVVVYIILSGRPPFDDRDEDGLHAYLSEVLRFEGREWALVSPEAKDFVRRCLDLNEAQRITARQALAHVWLRDA